MESFHIMDPDADSVLFLHDRILKDLGCRTLSLRVIKHLLENGADRNAADVHGITLMHLAALPGIWSDSHLKQLTDILLENKTSLTVPDKYGWTPLHWARASDCIDKTGHVARLIQMAEHSSNLITNGPFKVHPDMNTPEDMKSHLFPKAAQMGNVGILQKLVDVVEIADPAMVFKMLAMLHVTAAYYEQNDVLSFLIAKTNRAHVNESEHVYGTNLSIQSGNPLHIASYCGHERVIRQLLDVGAEVNARSGQYQYALIAASAAGHRPIVQMLLDEGANINAKNKENWTALMFAAAKGHKPVVELLLGQNGIRVDSRDITGNTPLSLAASNGHEEIVELLAQQKGINANQLDSVWRRTPLSIAAEMGHYKVVKILLDNGAQVDLADNVTKDTPLAWAAEEGHERVALLLLVRGANPHRQNSIRKTPMAMAGQKGHDKIVRMMSRKGPD